MDADPRATPPADVIPIHRGPRSNRWPAAGVALFLGSWGISFLALFVLAVAIRTNAPQWPPPGIPPLRTDLPLANTLDAVLASLAVHVALGRLRAGRREASMRWLAAALLLGLGFLCVQAFAWRDVALSSTPPGPFRGLFHVLTGFHAAHVAASVAWLARVLRSIASSGTTPADHAGFRYAVWFAHFTTAAWLGTAAVLYV